MTDDSDPGFQDETVSIRVHRTQVEHMSLDSRCRPIDDGQARTLVSQALTPLPS